MLLSNIIQKIAKVAHTSNARPVLQSVRITNDKVVCTDGFRLLEYKLGNTDSKDFAPIPNYTPCELVEGESLLINAKELLAFKFKPNKMLPILNNALLCNKRDGYVSLLSTDLQSNNIANFRLVSGEYPQYESIIPTLPPTASITVNAQYMIDVLQAFIDKNKVSSNVTINFYGASSPLKFTNEDQTLTGLLMPLKS